MRGLIIVAIVLAMAGCDRAAIKRAEAAKQQAILAQQREAQQHAENLAWIETDRQVKVAEERGRQARQTAIAVEKERVAGEVQKAEFNSKMWIELGDDVTEIGPTIVVIIASGAGVYWLIMAVVGISHRRTDMHENLAREQQKYDAFQVALQQIPQQDRAKLLSHWIDNSGPLLGHDGGRAT